MSGNPLISIDQVAHHAARAAELVDEIGPVPGVPSDIADRAVALLFEAASRSMDVGAFNQTRRQTTRALDLGPTDVVLARELLLLRAHAQVERRAVDQARGDAEDALEAASAAGDRRQEGIARRLLGVLDQRDGDLAGARRELGESVEIFRALGDDTELASSLRERGLAEVFGGSLSDADWLLGEAEGLTERLGDVRGQAWVRQHQAWVAFFSGNTELAESRLLTAAHQFDLLGDRFGRGWAEGLLAYVRFYQRRFDEAEELAVRVRDEATELGDPWAPAMMDALIASIRLWTCEFAEADEYARRALASFRGIGDKFGTVQALAPRMRALVALGRSHEAERSIEEAMALGESFGNLSLPMMAAAGAAVHLGLGDRAVEVGREALDRTLAMGSEGSETRVTLGLALCQTGRPDDALVMIDQARLQTPYLHSVRAIARAMTGDRTGAIDDGDAVAAGDDASYLDRITADIAAAAAELGAGDRAGATTRLDRAGDTADGCGDVVARALVNTSRAALLDGGTVADGGHLGVGWHRIIDALVVSTGRSGEGGIDVDLPVTGAVDGR